LAKGNLESLDKKKDDSAGTKTSTGGTKTTTTPKK